MKRTYTLVVAVTVVVFMVLAGCAPQAAQPDGAATPASEAAAPDGKVYEWKVFANGNAAMYTHQKWMGFAEDIDTVTDGRLKINFFCQGEHPYKPADMLGAVSDRACDIALIDIPNMSGVEPRVTVLDLPMLLPPSFDFKRDLVYRALGEDGTVGRILSEDWNTHVTLLSWWGPQYIWLNDGWLEDWDSLQGKKIRTYSTDMDNLITMLNGTPVRVDSTERYMALQTGLINGFITGVTSSCTDKLPELSKHLIPLHIFTCSSLSVVNNDSWNELPGDLREAFTGYLDTNRRAYETGCTKEDGLQLIEAFNTYGLKVQPVPQSFVEDIRQESADVIWQPWIDRTPDGAEIFSEIVEEIKGSGYTVPGY